LDGTPELLLLSSIQSCDITASNSDLSSGGRYQLNNCPGKRCLATPTFSNESHGLSDLNCEANAVDGMHLCNLPLEECTGS
jgi:hypothetical protein